MKRISGLLTLAVFFMLLVLLSALSCQKKNRVMLSSNTDIMTDKFLLDSNHEIILLGAISLNSHGSYEVFVKDLPDGLYALGILVYPQNGIWKSNDKWKKSMMKMIVKNGKGRKLISSHFTFAQLFNGWYHPSTKEPLFLFGSQPYGMSEGGRYGMIDWKSNTLVSHIPTELPKDPEEEYYKETPSSWFEAKKTDTYTIHIDLKGGCPEGVSPDAKIGLVKFY